MCVFLPVFLRAQCLKPKRTYASHQGYLREGLGILGGPALFYGEIENADNAVNGVVTDASTLKVGLGLLNAAATTQFLEFKDGGLTSTFAANTSVIVKISVPSQLVGVLTGVEIGSFTNMHDVSASWPLIGLGNFAGQDAVKTPIYNSVNIAEVISGTGEIEIALTPHQAFNGVYVKLSSIVALGSSIKVFHAYVMENTTTPLACNEVVDVLSGVIPTVVGGVLNVTDFVDKPERAIDGDVETFAALNTGVSVLNKVFLSPIYSNPSQPGDEVTIILSSPSALLEADLLTGFTVQPYLNGVKAGPPFKKTGTFLSIDLLTGSTDKYVMTFPVSTSYDRLEISAGGVLGALDAIRVHEIIRKPAKPISAGIVNNKYEQEVCQGSTATFTLNNLQACTTYKWYDAETGGNEVGSGSTFAPPTTLTAGSYDYYVRGVKTYCSTEISDPLKVTLKVNPLPTLSVPGTTICSGSSAILSVTTPDAGFTYNWYSVVSGGTTLKTGNSYTTPALSTNTTYYVEAVNQLTGCKNASREPVDVILNPLPNLTFEPNPGICEGLTTTKIAYTNPVFDPISYSISWAGNLLPAVSDQTLPANEITINVPSNTPVAVYQGVLTIKNANGCERAIPFSFRVKLVPHKPTVSIN